MWFNIIGTTLGFLGSIIFSAGLIKSKEQIHDENRSYYGSNPYTEKAELTSQPYYIAAFVMLISGFAIALGGSLGEEFASKDVLASVLFAASIAFAGYLVTALFYINRVHAHLKAKDMTRREVFRRSLENYADLIRKMKKENNTGKLYDSAKQTYHADLLEKARRMEANNAEELKLAKKLEYADDAQEFIIIAEHFMDSVPARK